MKNLIIALWFGRGAAQLGLSYKEAAAWLWDHGQNEAALLLLMYRPD